MTGRIIEGPYLKDILDQPAALEDTIGALAEQSAGHPVIGLLHSPDTRRLVLTGMGSSLHALHTILPELETAGVPVTMVETSELIHYRRHLLARGSLVIAVSQSGHSVEIVRLLEANGGLARVVGVVNDPASPLAERADAAVLMRAGTEFSVSTKTYVATLAALVWLVDALRGSDLKRTIEELREAPVAAASYLSRWRGHAVQAAAELEGAAHIFFAGRGPSLASAGTAGLITKESTHFHAEGMSAAAFRHGPFEMLSDRVFVLVFEGDARTADLNRGLVRDVTAAAGRAALAGPSGTPDVFRLPEVGARIRPILEILPVEMMTLALGAMAGREAGRFERATKVTSVE